MEEKGFLFIQQILEKNENEGKVLDDLYWKTKKKRKNIGGRENFTKCGIHKRWCGRVWGRENLREKGRERESQKKKRKDIGGREIFTKCGIHKRWWGRGNLRERESQKKIEEFLDAGLHRV